MCAWRSPRTGAGLVEDTPHSLRDPDGTRWPVVDSIPFLRVGRDALAGEALARLDAGDHDGALAALLADQDDWWTSPPPAAADVRALVRERHRLCLRDAMGLLGFGRVGDYFAHRWSDPTFLAGLALIEAHRRPADAAFELACGIGHYGREMLRRGLAYTGADVVFAKLWLARGWVTGESARLVCFDAAGPWPVADQHFDVVLCQDAFYFLEPKSAILERLRALCGSDGWLAVGHIHNRDAANLSAGSGLAPADLAVLFPDGILYDDAELTAALVAGKAPAPQQPETLGGVEAFAVACGPGLGRRPRPLTGGFAMPVDGASLRVNPLYLEGAVAGADSPPPPASTSLPPPPPEPGAQRPGRRTHGGAAKPGAPSSFETPPSAAPQDEGSFADLGTGVEELRRPSERSHPIAPPPLPSPPPEPGAQRPSRRTPGGAAEPGAPSSFETPPSAAPQDEGSFADLGTGVEELRRPSERSHPPPSTSLPAPHPEPGAQRPSRRTHGGAAEPRAGAGAWELRWPSERYRDEYGPLATYPAIFREPRTPGERDEAIRRRALVDLPERW